MMKLIQNLLSHMVLLMFIAALVLTYIYRAHLFSDDINARVDGLVYKAMVTAGIPADKPEPVTDSAPEDEATQTTQLASDTETSAVETAQTEDINAGPNQEETSQPDSVAEALPLSEAEPTVDESTAEVSTTVASTSDASSTEPTASKEDSSDVATAPAGSKDEKVVASETENVQVAPASEPVSTDKEASKTTNSDLLNQARLAFQLKQSDKSISLYQELAGLNPDDPNVHGEMGNVFYAQGKWKRAGAAYYEAAIRLLKQGNTGQVQYLYRVIQGLDKDSAEKLRTQLGQ